MNPEEISQWLAHNAHDRPWLAAELGVALGTLNNWFSKGFPPWAIKAISRIANPTGDKSAGLEVTFTAKEFDRIEQARQISGHPTRTAYYEDAITEFTDQILEAEKRQASPQTQERTAPATFTTLTSHTEPEFATAADKPGESIPMPKPIPVRYESGRRKRKR